MKPKMRRKIALLMVPFLIIGGVALLVRWNSDPRFYVEGTEVGALSLERELFLTGDEAQRRVHLATVVSWNREAVQSTPTFRISGEQLQSSDEELSAPNGKVWRFKDRSLNVYYKFGGVPQDRLNLRGKELNKLHWMVTIPVDAPTQDLKFSAMVTVPGLEKKRVTFLARPAWKTVRPPSLKVESVSWEHRPTEYQSDPGALIAVVRLRHTGKQPLFCDRAPLRRTQKPPAEDYSNNATFTPKASPQGATLIWKETRWVEDSRGKILMKWRHAKGGDMNFNTVSVKTPYLNPQGLIVVRYEIPANIYQAYLPTMPPLRIKAQLGIVGEGILPLNLTIPKVAKRPERI
jgi:hypothetical protein